MIVDWRSRHFAFRGRAGEPPRRFAPAGSPLPRTPAGVFVPSAPINKCFLYSISALLINKKVGTIFYPKDSSQNEYELVSIDELVPDEHFLRLIDK
jgi:hypothetical protein